MPWTIERLRLAVMAMAAVLLLAIVGFFVYGRWRLRHVAQDLPSRLGLQIQQSTRGFVLSKTEQGRTVFTLHAARAVAFKSGGRVLLHDVEIDLFNRQDGKADTISGKDFQYDRNSQIVIAQGEAHMMLHPPVAGAKDGVAKKKSGQIIYVTTHGLVFNQKTGMATCSGEVDFQIADSSGQAVGAEYDSKQGHLLLQSQVVLMTKMQNRPAVVHASQAVYDRNESQVLLQQPRYRSETPQGSEQGSAGTATIFLRQDGSAKRLDAQNNVELSSTDGTTVKASMLQATLNENSQPRQMHFFGGVQFTESQPAQQTHSRARDAVVSFDSQGRAQQAVLDRDVEFQQQANAGKNHLQRTLTSNHLVLHLSSSKTGRQQLQTANATGNAVFRSQSVSAGHPPQETRLAAQTLNARFLPGNEIEHIDGAGQTFLRTVAANGDIDTSSGDTLTVDFETTQRKLPNSHASVAIKPTAKAVNDALTTQSVRTAIQTGHVVLQQTASGKSGGTSAPRTSIATASRADYAATNDTLTLTGQPVFRDAQLEMAASRMEVERSTGKMIATGVVRATLRSTQPPDDAVNAATGSGLLGGGNQPVHVIATQAVLLQDSQQAIFRGQARLWQGGNTVEAPVIAVSQKTQTLLAYSVQPCSQCVHSTFLGQRGTQPAPSLAAPAAQGRPKENASSGLPSIFRVVSERLLYSDAERKASFLHHVEVISSSGQLFADHADIFLAPAAPSGANRALSAQKKKAENLPSGRNSVAQSSVERIVASGNVRLVQPGRSATGARLVYTASDGRFVLTGDDSKEPEVTDVDRGTVTGQILTFSSQQQAIIVGGTSAHTTITRTRIQKK